MARKKIADLLKEAVGQSMGVTPSTESMESASSDPSAPDPQALTPQPPLDDTSNGSQEDTDATKRRRSPTKADLEATVADLTAQLESAHLNETTHQAKIAQLQHDLKQMDALNAELAEAKTTILQLVETNTNTKVLQDQVKTLQGELAQEKAIVASLRHDLQVVTALKAELANAQKRIAQLSAIKPTPASGLNTTQRSASRSVPLSLDRSLGKSSKDPATMPVPTDNPKKFLSAESKFKRMRKASIDHQQPTNTLSDREIGWFD